ncbi:hypothetical protein DB88DRAFT_492493 [Papiliotrema laurentii]|uniref:NADH dehydrogenase [ubiquinone] 1 beta subcomplex subunit 9 n=1 Tax=Papiliotrema laurentii TaxID=5418 RepID=A0AAD9FLK8_PAPLA|nr:hypothetical protein DB88DRAFT_492493 [Papiliotrema laurentii]
MSASVVPFSQAHRFYVKSLYRRFLTNSLNWTINRALWREKAIEIRAEFERNRNITDPRALAIVLEQAEAKLAEELHPDPYRVPTAPDGTKWERNTPPPMFTPAEKEAARQAINESVGFM